MTIDINPIIDSVNYTFTVLYNIDITADVNITVNGVLAIFNDDIVNITNNIITVNNTLNLDFTSDIFTVIYDRL